MMRMDVRLVQTQSQRLMLTQKMQQALQILQYNAQELDLHVQHELETNPVLEQVSPEPAPEPMPEKKSENGQDGPDANDIVFDLDQFISPWEQRMARRFEVFDRDLSGTIDRDEFTWCVEKMDALVTQSEIDDMMAGNTPS